MIAFINVDYSRHSCFWMNFALNKRQKHMKGYTFRGMKGYGVILETGYVLLAHLS